MKNRILAISLVTLLLLGCRESRDRVTFTQTPPDLKLLALADTFQSPELVHLTPANTPDPLEIKPQVIPLKYPFGVGQPTFKSFGAEDGFTSDLVMDLVFDHKGNLWIAAAGFLSKFDGTTFTDFYSFDQKATPLVNQLLVDSKGMLWIANADGLYTYDGKFFEKFSLGIEEGSMVYSILESKSGSIWASTPKGVFQIEGDSITNHGLESDYFGQLHLTHEDKVIYTGFEGNYRFENGEFLPITITTDTYADILLVDRQGAIWFSTRTDGKRQIGKLAGDQLQLFGEKEGISPTDNIFNMIQDRSGNYWILGNENIYRIIGSQLTTLSGFTSGQSFFKAFVEDEFGNFWLGGSSGLKKMSLSYQNSLETPLKQISPNSIATDFSIDSLGFRWAVTSPSFLIQYQEKESLVWDLKPIMGQGFINNLFIDQKGVFWLTTGGPVSSRKLIRFDGKQFTAFFAPEYLKLDFISQVSEDPKGNLVIAGEGGITFFDGQTFTHLGNAQGYPTNATNFLRDSNGSEWIGTDEDGVFVYRNDSVLHIGNEEGLPNIYVNEVAEDPMGNIWIANDGGLTKFDGKVLTNYGPSDGIGNIVGAITISSKDSLILIGSSAGVSKLPFREIDSPRPKFTTYSKMNGFELVPNTFFSNSKILEDSFGMWLTEIAKGIVRFDPKVFKDFKAPVLELKNIGVKNTEVLWSLFTNRNDRESTRRRATNESYLKLGKAPHPRQIGELYEEFGNIEFDSLSQDGFIPVNLILPYTNNNLTFEFSTISPSFGKFSKYRYFLEGYDRNWSPFNASGEAYYGNIPEGAYTLNVEALSTFGTISTLSYPFRVLPPWWRTWWAYLLYFIGLGLAVRWIYQIQKNKLIAKEKEKTQAKELAQAKEIEKAYHQLKSTQAQLIQSEKMASLGELTAGIAHEIQNPLNFVNNFSEVSTELVEEIQEARTKNQDKIDIELENEILGDIKQNLEKITLHGKRADAIVKGMLEHSRTNKGEKTSTDLNALVDEFVRLSYHGLRAKDKSFKADFKLDLDPHLPKVHVVASDMGRVILNLVNNAFYAVNEKNKSRIEGYLPEIIVKTTTTKSPFGVEISISDNGPGIPDSIKDKIFQPFFTTKPTGQGTGLGLSLSYDIVKAHGGELRVKNAATVSAGKEDKESLFKHGGSEFIIRLPI